MTVPTGELASIELHREAFGDLLVRMETAIVRGRHEAAAALGAMAADFASRHHPGWFAHPDLERMLIQLGGTISVATSEVPRCGHIHLVDVAAPGPVFDIAEKMQLVAADHSEVVIVEPSTNPLARAAELRRKIDEAEVVFLHTEPQAVEMTLALAGWRSRPPVVVVNHHETVFWTGVGVADVLVSHTASGRALGVDRRFVSPARSRLLPGRDVSPDIWRGWVEDVDRIVRAMHPAWLPQACLPAPAFPKDLEIAQWQRVAGRSDGLAASWARSGRLLERPDRPSLSVVVVGREGASTLECLHRVLDAAPDREAPQLIVIDTGHDPDLADLLDTLGGLVLRVPMSPSSEPDPLADGLRWCWGSESVLLPDACRPEPAAWSEALTALRSTEGGLVRRPDQNGVEQIFVRTELVTLGAGLGTVGEKSSRLVTPS